MSRILARFRQAELRAETYRTIAKAIREGNPHEPLPKAKLPGDPRALRGIPCIARGVGGTQPGTSPEGEAVRKGRAA